MNSYVLPTEYQKQFKAARAVLERAGKRVKRTGYNYGLYEVIEGNKTTICSQSDIVRWAERLKDAQP